MIRKKGAIKRFKWAVAALLGFSTACSTVRPAATGEQAAQSSADTMAVPAGGAERPRIVVMYGVRAPRPVPQDDTSEPAAGGPVETPAAEPGTGN